MILVRTVLIYSCFFLILITTGLGQTITITQQPVNPNNRCAGQNFTFSTDATGTTNITFQWQKFNSTTSLFENLSNGGAYSGTNTKNLLITNVQSAQAGDYRCMIQGDLATTVYCNTGTLTVNPVPTAPSVANGSRCGSGAVTVTASGTTDGNYIWYGSNGMSEPIAGENNSTYLTPALTNTTTYYVSIVNSFCESVLVPVDAVINPIPATPTVTNASNNGCGTQSLTLKATAAGSGTYQWFENSTATFSIHTAATGEFTTPELSASATYYVSFSDGTCESSKAAVTATVTNPGPGSIDLSFAPAANSLSNFSAIDDVEIQSDGKFVLNYFETASTEYYICRLLTDGTLDPLFTQRPRSQFTGRPDLVTLQADGKILAGGRMTNITGIGNVGRIVRLNADGSWDNSFNTTSPGFNNTVRAIEIQTDNKIIAGGVFTSYNGSTANRIVRINESNGSMDGTFITGTGFNGEVKRILIRSDGKILVSGAFSSYNGTAVQAIVLLNSNGSLDNSFTPPLLTSVGEMGIQADGKILIQSDAGFIRLNNDGTKDNSFSIGSGFDADVNKIYIESSGKILVAGDFQNFNGTTRNFVARLNPNGSLDKYFDTGIGSYTWTYDILSAGTNQVFIAGYFDKWNNQLQNGIAKISNACIRTPIGFNASSCNSTITLNACGGFNGDYRWYTTASGGSPIAGETSSAITINNLTATTTYYVTLNDGICESVRVPVVATLASSSTAAPTTIGAVGCSGAALLLTATGGANGQYRWYTTATGGTPLAGETSSSFTTPALTSTTVYYVAINDGTCESSRTSVTATITSIASPTTTGSSLCGTGPVTLSASGGTAGQYRWYTAASGGSPISGETAASYTTPVLTTTTTYYVSINNGTCESGRSSATATISSVPTAPSTTGASSCGSASTLTLSATGGTNGQYRWYTVATGGSPISGETNSTYTTASITNTTTFYVAINNGVCESNRAAVVATINTIPAAPITTGASACGPTASVVLSASGGTNGQYRWYTASSGGIAISGEVNSTLATPALSATATYYVAINNSVCESNRTGVLASITPPPSKPVITIISGSPSICNGQSIVLAGPSGSGLTYKWSNGSTTQQITVSSAGTFSLQTISSGCTSSSSDPVVVSIITCNQPPVITSAAVQATVEGSVSLKITDLLSDPDNNLDLTTLRIVIPPKSGASAVIDSNFNLILNYRGLSFAGADEITIEVCDTNGACAQQKLLIEVVGDIIVYNAISANGDGKNAMLFLQYIEAIPETKQNKVSIYNRWGDLVWEGTNYDNSSIVFIGLNKNGNDLPSGTYFYKIEYATGRKTDSGYLSLKR